MTVFEKTQNRIQLLHQAEQECVKNGKMRMAVNWMIHRKNLADRLAKMSYFEGGQEYNAIGECKARRVAARLARA